MLDAILKLKPIGGNRFITANHQESFQQSLFGGQAVAQALMAANHTVEGRPPHSLHAYFLRPGTTLSPVEYAVREVRTGTTIATREVIASQNGKDIFTMLCSFHAQESGVEHQRVHVGTDSQATAPTTAPPSQSLLENRQVSEFLGKNPIDYWAYDNLLFSEEATSADGTRFWFRSKSPLDQPIEHYAALAFASDIGLLATSLLSHETSLFSGKVKAASIDHAVWFHQQPKFEQWHQYITTSPWAGNARALCQGHIHDAQGGLVASVCQEGLIRLAELGRSEPK